MAMGDYRIFLSACEASAEKHCVELMASIRAKASQRGEGVEFAGIGGNRMRQGGCELIADTVSKAAMIYNAFGQIGYYYKLIRKVRRFFKENPQDVVVVCDSPAFNFHVAKAASKSGAAVIFYVAPQLWAWAPWRIGKMRKCCDKLACILPFEEQWFSARGIDAEFVGNPLFDEIDIDLDECVKSYSDYSPQSATVALLAGSRDAEIKTLWQPMQKIAAEIKRVYSDARFIAVAADDEKLEMLRSMQIEGFECQYRTGGLIETCREADYAFVASGSATLQVASAACPMTVMYQSSRLLWHLLGRWLINIKDLSLVNILARRRVVPEFMPYFTSVKPICDQAVVMLADGSKLAAKSRELAGLVKPLAKINSADAVADKVLRAAEQSRGVCETIS
jgi:lipid-A-disaccharide synthase